MAVTGVFSDRFLNLFNENLLNELQQEGSRLANLFPRERMKGQKAHFDKIGITTSHQKTSRLQDIVPDEENYERRLLTFQTHYAAYTPDINDLMDMVADPTSDLLRNMGFSLGRKMDEIIMTAIKGNAVVQANGSTTNTALPAAQLITVSDITFDLDLTAGDKGLTPGKLMEAVKILKQNYVMDDLVVIAPAGQLANIIAHARASSGDFRSARPLESPGLEGALTGYLGLNFVHYEETGVDGSADELVYVVGRNAVKVGERMPLTTKLAPRVDKVGHPQQLHSFFDLGATRMYEEAVVQIACDPRK
jgi:hypothetical protein